MTLALHAGDPLDVSPIPIQTCLQIPSIQQKVDLDRRINPYYLRGDFDGDARPDYAVAVRGRRTGRLRVLMCLANGRAFVLGSEGGEPPFSDMANDNFFGDWQVYSVDEAKRIGRYFPNEPRKLPSVRGEVVVMIWEDGLAAIYWDGRKFRWAAR